MHHIVTDGTSNVILSRDFLALYNGEELEPLRLQYKDFSHWQNRLFEGGAIKAREYYWLSLYSDIAEIPRLNLPGDHKRPKVFTFAGNQYSFKLDRDDAIKFKVLGTGIGGTLYMNILAALNVLFYRYTGQTDIIIGGVTAGRPHADLQRIIGMFVNTVAMRNQPEGEKRYRSFLKEVIAQSVEVFENQDVQFEELVEKLGVERDLSRNPLFDVTMVVQDFAVELPIVEGEDQYTNKTAKFDMTFFVVERGDDIHIAIEYYTGIFKEETIHRLAVHFRNVIKAVTTDPVIQLKDIDILSEEEREEVLYTFNDTGCDYPGDRTVHELFAEQVERTPDKVAVSGVVGIGTKRRFIASVTYRELNRKSNQLAYLLRGKDVGPDSIVGIMLERCIEMIIAILGVLKAGGAYLPINPHYPQDRIDYMSKDSGVGVLVRMEGNRLACSTVLESSTLASTYRVSSANLAYIIYTSGTTGRPKAVMVEHINVVRLVKNTDYIEFRNDDRILQTGALEFDASTFEIWGSLLNGLELYLVTNEIILSAEKLKEVIQRSAITTMWLTSSLFNRLLDAEIEMFGGLRNLLVGGDVLSPVHIDQLRNRFPRLNVINGYGPTENTTFSTTYLINKEHKNIIPIGRPIANSTVYIVDKYTNVLPVGIPGELVVGGDGVSRGYLNNPDLTGEKFIEYRSNRSYRTYISYKTGDLARWLPDGNIEFLGRIDQQVKLRGFRVELGEIESELMNHPAIKEVVVIVREDTAGDKHLCAYVVCEGVLAGAGLKEFLAKKLPTYMIPSFFVILDKMPLTPNGKVDRKALPAPGIRSEKRYIAPRDELEEKLAAIWSDVLGIEQEIIGIDANFFELGGHSIKATIMIARIHKDLNAKIPLVQLFKTPTIRELAKQAAAVKENFYEPILSVEEKEYYRVSHAQKRVWVLSQVPEASISFNIPMAQLLERELDIPSFERTFAELVKRHDSLRTIFVVIDGEPMQRVLSPGEMGFKVEYIDRIDLEVGSDKERNIREPRELVGRESIAPFDLSTGPLLRVILIRLAREKYLIFLNIHHIISDFLSQGILVNEMFTLYNAFASKEENPLKPLPIQYKDYAAWHNEQLAGDRSARDREYWLSRLKGESTRLKLPLDKKRPLVQTYNGADVIGTIEEELFGKLQAFSKKENVTLFMTLLTMLNVLFYHYTGQSDIVLGTVIAGREHADLRRQVGCYLNTLVLRTYCDSRDTFIGALKKVKDVLTGAYYHQAYPFDRLVEDPGGHRDVGRHPFFDVLVDMINYNRPGHPARNGNSSRDINVQDIRGENFGIRTVVAKFDLAIYLLEGPDTMTLRFEYNTDLFERKTIERMVNRFRTLVEMALEKPDSLISKLRLEQKHRLPAVQSISRETKYE